VWAIKLCVCNLATREWIERRQTEFYVNERFWGRVPGYRSRARGFDSRRYQIFLDVAGLERGPLSLVTTEELLDRKSRGSGLERREYGRRDPSR
jgi:hypothetical protein